MAIVVGVTAPGVVELIDEPDSPLTAGQVRVRTLYSGISAGTELTTYRGTSPHLNKQWDAGKRLFVDGADHPAYPVTVIGYEEVGEITELGPSATGVAVGDRVWGTWGHRSTAVLEDGFAAARVLPADADPRIGMFSHIGAVALNAVLDANIRAAETVAVFGLGVPGQLVAQLARLHGARVLAVDGIEARRDLATRLGAHSVVEPVGAAESIRSLTGDKGADVAIEISGNYLALHEAIRSVGYNSRVCAAGFYQGEAGGLRLGEEFHHNRVQLISSQISGQDPAIQHRWDRYRLNSTVLGFAIDGRLDVLSLISSEVPYTHVADAYRTLDENPRDNLQVVLDFTGAP